MHFQLRKYGTVKITVKSWQPIALRFTGKFTVMFLQ